jgi:hypothetical protein
MGNDEGVCAAVYEFTVIIEREFELSNEDFVLARLLSLMPLYHSRQNLDQWEYVIQISRVPESDQPANQLLWECFEFGRENLYCKFSAENQYLGYERLKQLFLQNSIQIPKYFQLDHF